MTTRGTRQALERLREEKRYTRTETAAILGMSVPRLVRIMAARKIGFRQLGGRYYFTDEDIERYNSDTYYQPVLPGLESPTSEEPS